MKDKMTRLCGRFHEAFFYGSEKGGAGDVVEHR